MLKKLIYLMLLAPILFLASSGTAFATSSYLAAFTTNYQASYQAQHPGQSLTIAVCSLCHVAAGPPNLNLYGDAFFNSTFNFAAIEALDSDGDGFSNLTEIMAYPETYPGNALSFPATAADTTAPTVTAFTIPATASTLTVAITSLTATDAVGVTGYMVTESATAPLAGNTGWSATAPTTFTFTSAGAKTLYAWAKDAAGNISAVSVLAAASTTITLATVPAAPTIGTATAGDGQATVSFSAPASNGGSAITGYTVTSSPGGVTASGSSSPVVVTGLTNGIAYTFTVTATNAIGTGPASAASNSVTPIQVIAGTCATLDATLNVNIPCIDVGGQFYQVGLNRYENPTDFFGYYWSLGTAVPTTNNGSCASFDNTTWLVTLPCVEVNGTNYTVNLNYWVNPAAPQQFFWTLGSAHPNP